MFGSTVYPQVSEFHDQMTYASENLSHLIPSANIPHPWNRGASLLQDFVMVTEFSELEGPKPLFVQPSEGLGNFDINAFAVKIMSVDHQPPKNGFTLIEDKQVLLSETAERVSAYVYYFILYDSQARGYVRPFCMAYVTPDCRKLVTFYKEIHEAFSKVSHDLKVGNLRLFATEMRHQLRDLDYSFDCLIKLSKQEEILAAPPPEESSVTSDSSNITLQSVKLLKEETEAILEVLQQNKALFENSFVEFHTTTSVDCKCDIDSQDGSSCGSFKETELDSLHQRAPVFSKDHSKSAARSDNHHNIAGQTKHLAYRPYGDSSSSESDLEKRLCDHHESKAHIIQPGQERASTSFSQKPLEIVHNHVTRLKSDSSVKPSMIRNDLYVRVSSVDRSHSCSDIWSSVDGQKDSHEYILQGPSPVILHSSESDFSTSSTSSQLDHPALDHSDTATALIESRADKLEHVLLMDDEINYKPKLYKPPSRKRFEFMLRNLKTLCLNESGTDQWKQLGLIQQHFSQDLAILKMHRLEKSLADPSCALVTFGGCITNNFLHGLYRCDLESEFGTSKNLRSSVEKFSAKNDTMNELTRISIHSMPSEDAAASSSSCLNLNSDLSQSTESSLTSSSSHPNLIPNPKLSPHQQNEEWIIFPSSQNEPESASEQNHENLSLCFTCSEHSKEASCNNCKEPRIADKGTFHHMLCDTSSSKGSTLSFDEGSDDSFHSVSSIQSLIWPKSYLWKKPCRILADLLHSKEHEQQAQSLMHILQQYQNLNQLVASILSGRPVVVIGKSQSEEEVKTIIDAFSLFLPGNLRDHKKRTVPWLKRPLHLKDLSKMQLVGLCRPSKRRYCVIPLSLMSYVSILDIEQRLVVAPHYQGKIVNSMLRQLQQFQNSPNVYLSYIHSCFQEMSSKAFLYYHSFCMTSVNPSSNNGCVSLEKLSKEFKDTSEQFLKTCNILHGDRKIIEYIASLVLKQVLKETQAKSATRISDSGSSRLHISYKPSFKWDC